MSVAHSLGFPRIGLKRELKTALEKYWRGELSRVDLDACARALRAAHWQLQADAGVQLLPVGDFSYYDHVLDTSFLFGVIPERFVSGVGDHQDTTDLDLYFRAARGRAPTGADAPACEMTKWFDSNYHYIVPEFSKGQTFTLNSERLISQIQEAQALGHKVKPVLLGPVSYLYLGKARDGSNKLELLPKLLLQYQKLIQQLEALKLEWLQLDEPILVLDLDQAWQDAFRYAYKNLQDYKLQLLLATYFGSVKDNLALIKELAVDGLHVDAVRGAADLDAIIEAWPKERVLSLGVVDGRNIWRTDLRAALLPLTKAQQKFNGRVWVASSSSLLHTPVDLDAETRLDPELRSWLAFAKQKTREIAVLSKALNEGVLAVDAELTASDRSVASRRSSTRIHKPAVKARLSAITKADSQRKSAYAKRAVVQHGTLNLPLFPTTTIGSFPQTADIRGLRAGFKKGAITEPEYVSGIKAQIADHVKRQEALDIDVLVHGEAERNDMVEYFGEQLEGFAFTENGWVQSYGSRCVKPPIIYGDVSRPKPITVGWTTYAQSLTNKPLKGMLTGPITILCWSFTRNDLSRKEQAEQIALALRDEVQDLEKAGTRIIQIDEPAIREGLPLKKAEQPAYLDWAVTAFRLCTAGVSDGTQIHTHMCYSEFNEIIDSIAALDADVITIETSRSNMELLEAFEKFSYPNEIGPGVYDIHSPIVPGVAQIEALIEKAAQYIPRERLWINPDCGLKTRQWPETEAALANLVQAAKNLRAKYGRAAAA
ncbi:5-methyltetrahydropteroyltriglutamate--homocysteine S-methyltransferase [Permianibacter sp. IMCC34836]|uniref:5-methyltetrahydropteroyltriglutamate-- homocysteine S-methyltransferase n=1 Tax=Permianibacter fluminis TaxID=2738515 RepID=UPI0015570CC7|nr:5-methyltetrahydropteroyltriglutamate--homocysteine S-methyltransferase [Permianibacter fluminis]NQD37793.1 5-methyltetrahydropteroyltriglutamate--homocysteine S-methyltransferase [Permianibacter fluminis]